MYILKETQTKAAQDKGQWGGLWVEAACLCIWVPPIRAPGQIRDLVPWFPQLQNEGNGRTCPTAVIRRWWTELLSCMYKISAVVFKMQTTNECSCVSLKKYIGLSS